MTLLRLVASLVYWSNKKRIRNVEDVEQAIQATSDNVDHELEELPGPGVVDDESTVNSYGPAPSFRYMPLLSGVIIPFSILLEIPGLTEHWYIRTEGNDIVDIKNNPSILDAGLGLSMASAVLANVCLLMRFMERRVKLMTLLCIFFLTVHDIINIIAVTTFGVEHRFNDGFTYGQAFWITVCSTVTSVVTNVSLIVDLIRTPEFVKYGSGLTRKQRSLIILVMIFLIYVALCALVNAFILDRPFLDAMYFTLVSVETIGFGDVVPKSPGARVWTCAFAAGGIIILGAAVGNISDAVFEALEHAHHIRILDIRRKRRNRQKQRRARGHKRSSWTSKKETGQTSAQVSPEFNSRDDGQEGSMRQESQATNEPEGLLPSAKRQSLFPNFDYQDFNDHLEEEKTKQFVMKLTFAWGAFVCFWLLGSVIFMHTEGWTYGTAMYFCFMTFSTIGFGDVTIQTPAGRAVFIFWALLGVATMTVLVSIIVDAFSSRYKSTTQLHVFDDAVRHYRNQRLGHAQQQQQQQQQQGRHDRQNLNDRLNRSISRSQLRQPVQDHLRTLPHEILDCARTLDERLRFFNSQKAIGRETNTKESTRNQASIPLSLARLLDEITDVKQLPDRVRHEILCDNNARQTLFMLSVEEALRAMIDAAERSLNTLTIQAHEDSVPLS